jgi:hypothetical protein
MAKTVCPITREQFKKADRLIVKIGDDEFKLPPKTFSTDSLGFGISGQKITVKIDGVWVTASVGLNVTLDGSKELPPE